MSDIFQTVSYRENEPMKNHTTFRVGGAARHFFMPKDTEELKSVIGYCKEHAEKYIVVGNGSNMLFPDEGYDGFVIQIYGNMSGITVDGVVLHAQAGVLLSKLASCARDSGLSGAEFAAGIPGTLGGAVVMNAGAYGGEMKDIIDYVDVLETDGEVRRYSCDEMDFGYRHSIIDRDRIVIGAGIRLVSGNRSDITARMEELKEARIRKQPLEYPSAGSTFKRPEGYFAGKLIQDSGLRGYRVGGAMVSEKHCGFVINYDNATAQDILALMDDVIRIVYDRYRVMLEPEVKIIR